MQFGARWGIARRLMLAANILLLAVVTATGILIGGLLLPWSSPEGLGRYWWLLPLLLPLALTLHPRTVPALLNWLFRRLGREPLGAAVSGAGLQRALLWSAACWLVFGLHLTALAGAFSSIDASVIAVGIGAMGLAWAAGIVFIPAPAGAGIREGVLVLTYTPLVGAPAALTIALASRVLLLLADIVLAGVGALSTRARRNR
jgi:preprotein translocase subunit SecG